MKFFTWLLVQSRIHTRDVLLRKTTIYAEEAGCPMCDEELETATHMLLHWPAVAPFWAAVQVDIPPDLMSKSCTSSRCRPPSPRTLPLPSFSCAADKFGSNLSSSSSVEMMPPSGVDVFPLTSVPRSMIGMLALVSLTWSFTLLLYRSVYLL
jgi:hypothetical protein